MLPPIQCFTCGCPIGDKSALFRVMRSRRVSQVLQKRGTLASQAAVDVGLQLDCSDILDTLGIVNDCCRGHLISTMEFSDYY